MENISFKTLEDAIHVDKNNGTIVDYYLFDEYEIHLNKIKSHSTQQWHSHTKISESILVTKGKLLCKYLMNGKEKQKYLLPGEMVNVGNSVHTFGNDTDQDAEFVVFRFVPDGTNKREVIKKDKKIIEEND